MYKYYAHTAKQLKEMATQRNLHVRAKKRDKVSLVSGLKEFDQGANPIMKMMTQHQHPPPLQRPLPPQLPRSRPAPPPVIAPLRMKAPVAGPPALGDGAAPAPPSAWSSLAWMKTAVGVETLA